MRSALIPSSLLVAAALLAVPAQAQERWVERAEYRFLGGQLNIEVESDVPGEIQIVRGRSGLLQVRAVSQGGVAAFGFQDRGTPRLNLTGIGGERLTYVVVVPTRTRVRVWLPDRDVPKSLGSLQRTARFGWEAAEVPGRGSGGG